MTATQPDLALAAVLDGANTSAEIAAELGVSHKHASVVINRLVKEGLLRWTARRLPGPEGTLHRGWRVLEAA